MADISTRMVLVRRLYLDARVASEHRDGPARMQAVLLADLAVETLVKALLEDSKERLRYNAPLAEMLDSIEIPDPLKKKALSVRRLRNVTAHDGIEPDDATVADLLGDAVEVLRHLFRLKGHDFDSFTMVNLVANPIVREPLQLAVANLDDLDKALTFVAIAFRRLEGNVQEIAGKAAGIDLWMYPEPLWADVQFETSCADGRERSTRRLLRAAASGMLGGDVLGLARLRVLLQPLLMDEAERLHQEERARHENLVRQPPDRAIVIWAIDFVALTAYSVERRCPELRQPVFAPRESKEIANYLALVARPMAPRWPTDSASPQSSQTDGQDLEGDH
jgi:hypothetical protein